MREEVGRAIGLSARKVQVSTPKKLCIIADFLINDLDLVSGMVYTRLPCTDVRLTCSCYAESTPKGQTSPNSR